VTSRSTTPSNKKIIKKVTELEKLSVQVQWIFFATGPYKNVIKTNLTRSLAGPISYPCLKRAVTLLKLSHSGRTGRPWSMLKTNYKAQ